MAEEKGGLFSGILRFFQSSSTDEVTVSTTGNTEGGRITTTTTKPRETPHVSIGRYDILQRIGMGGEAIVFSARNRENNNVYVLKAIRPTINNARNRPEAVTKMLSEIRHPNIVGFEECFIHKNMGFVMPIDQVCIVMEYCPGGDLYAKIRMLQKEDIRLPEEWIMKWLIGLVEALAYLHSKKYVHRDLKPENIFLAEDYSAKLGDFGVSRILDDDGKAQTFTGTMCYMAPEMLLPHDTLAYGSGIDIWALGCIAFELTAPSQFIFEMQHNQLPGFVLRKRGDAPDDVEKLRRIERAQHDTLRQLMPAGYSDDFMELIMQMLRADPSERISAAQILELQYVKDWKQRLAESPPRVDELEVLLLCRSFHWQGKTWIYTKKGDVTTEDVDVIVVPNGSLFKSTGGLARVIVAKEPSVQEQLDSLIDIKHPPGMAIPVHTPLSSETIKARGILHVVGPAVTTPKAEQWLQRTFQNCLLEASKVGAKSICFPAIGTGGAGISPSTCANAFFNVIKRGAPEGVEEITLLCNDIEILRAFTSAYNTIISSESGTQTALGLAGE